jgi:hypothetical protein
MLYTFRSSLLAMLVAISGLPQLMAQSLPTVAISVVPAPSVRVSRLIDTPPETLSDVRANQSLASTMAVVRNDSEHAIIAISARWVITDVAAKQKRTRQKVDVFLPAGVGRVVAAPKTTLYLGPNSCAGGSDPSRTILAMERRTFEGLGVLSAVEIFVDAIMFENGEMYAPDSAYSDEILARVRAAKEVAQFVHNAASRGRSRSDLRTDLSSAGQGKAGDHGSWMRDFATSLARLPDDRFDVYLTLLDRLREPVIIIRQR